MRTRKIHNEKWWLGLMGFAAFWVLMWLASCTTVKRTTSSIAVHDTVSIAVHDTLVQQHDRQVTLYRHDTVVVTPAYAVTDTYQLAQLATAGRYQSSKGNVHSTVTVANGQVIVTCEADSLRMVIANLVERTSTERDSIGKVLATSTHTAAVKDVYVKKVATYKGILWALVAIAVLGCIFKATKWVDKHWHL
jgi:hypothetical protein